MTLSIDARKGSTMAMAMPRDDIEISNFRNYVLKIEGEKKVSKNSQDKKLILKIGSDGVLYLDLINSGVKPTESLTSLILLSCFGINVPLVTISHLTSGNILFCLSKCSIIPKVMWGVKNASFPIIL